MPTLSAGQIATLWNDARGSADRTSPRGQDETATAVAIALCESGGDTQAHNDTPPDDSYGLWQINMLGSLGPARRRQFGLSRNSELFQPRTNAQAAVRVFRDAGNSFGPWSCYTNGSYLIHMGKARNASPEDVPGLTPGVSEGGLGDIPGLSALEPLFQEDTWKRVGMFAGGAVLLFVVGIMMFGDDLMNIIPVGRLGKVGKNVKRVRRVAG